MARRQELQVLLLEDNEHDMELIRRNCRRMVRLRCRIDWATSLEGAKTLIAAKNYDVALLDLELTDSWGLETLDKLRGLVPHLPQIVLTGATSEGLALEALRAGAQDYLSKDDLSHQLLERTIRYAIERHRLMGIVTRSERMASVGQLSAGIAHELNSPLAQIMAELGELKDGLDAQVPTSGLQAGVHRALARVEHIRGTVEALYSFSSAQRGAQKPFKVDKAVHLARRLAANNLRHVAKLEEDIAPVAKVYGDSGRLTQAVLDLLIHACEVAKSHQGRLGRVWLQSFERDGRAVIAVEDDGPAVPASLHHRLLEPFGASRVAVTQRRGLGLAAAREVAHEHGGNLEVMDGRHGGVRFELTLPLAEVPSQSTSDLTPPLLDSPHEKSRAKVLWIDDDVHLLRAFERRLRRDHDVDVCESAVKALGRIEQGERWDVICCDLMMPNLNGREFEEVLSRKFPQLAERIIFVTGGVFTEEERRFLEQTRQPRLLKPFDWGHLLSLVADVRARNVVA